MNNDYPQPPTSPPERRIHYGYNEDAYDRAKEDGLLPKFPENDWEGSFERQVALRRKLLQHALIKLEFARRGFYVKLIVPFSAKPHYWRLYKIGDNSCLN